MHEKLSSFQVLPVMLFVNWSSLRWIQDIQLMHKVELFSFQNYYHDHCPRTFQSHLDAYTLLWFTYPSPFHYVPFCHFPVCTLLPSSRQFYCWVKARTDWTTWQALSLNLNDFNTWHRLAWNVYLQILVCYVWLQTVSMSTWLDERLLYLLRLPF